MDWHAEKALMLEAVRDAGQLLMRYFRQEMQVLEKGPQDLVTEADLASESLIRVRIAERFPGDSVTAEESGDAGESSRRWYIDPLDGTVNFAHGISAFAACMAFVADGAPQLGIVYAPAIGECYSAESGSGAFLNGLPIRCSSTPVVSATHVYVNPHGLRLPHSGAVLEVYRRLGLRVQGMLNPGSMALALCSVACGRLDAAIGLDVDSYSTPASALILGEAGARVTDFDGRPYRPGVSTLIAANPTLHGEFAGVLQGISRSTA